MKKRNISSILFMLMTILVFSTAIISLSACTNDPNNNDENLTKLDMSYMEGLTIDLSGVTGFSINSNESALAQGCSDVVNDEIYNKNYIYSTNTYTHGDVEFDQNNIKKVTFKKNNKKTEVVKGPNGEIIDENTIITQDEIPALLNRMFVSGNFMYMQYILPYDESMINIYCPEDLCGIPVNTIDYYSDVDYATIKVRPNKIVYDEKGESIYDKKPLSGYDERIYYSSFCSQGFVMDLTSGYIYKLEGMSISEIYCNGIVKAIEDTKLRPHFDDADRGEEFRHYKLKINDKSELEFSRLIPNDNVKVKDPIMDKYGYLIVPNDSFDEIDKTNKIIYTTKKLYGNGNDGELCFSDSHENIPKYIYKEGVLTELAEVEMTVDNYYLSCYNGIWNNQYKYYKGKNLGNLVSCPNQYNTNIINWNTIVYESDDGYMYYKKVNLDECRFISLTEKDMIKISNNKCKRYNVDGSKKPYLKKISNNQFMIVEEAFSTESLNGTKYYTLEMENDIPVLKLIEDVTYIDNKFIFQPINK